MSEYTQTKLTYYFVSENEALAFAARQLSSARPYLAKDGERWCVDKFETRRAS